MSSALVPLGDDSQAQLALQSSAAVGTSVNMALPAPPKNQGTQQDGVMVNPDQKAKEKAARGYNELMDEYSLHQLMFRKGKLID